MRIVIKKFVELTTDELYEILKLRADTFIVEQQCPYADCDNRDRNAYHLYVEKNGHVWGCLRILEEDGESGTIDISRLAVHYEYRNIGLARYMMEKAIFFIMNYLDNDVIKIKAQAYLQEFFVSMGFEKTSPQRLEDGIVRVDMAYHMMCDVEN